MIISIFISLPLGYFFASTWLDDFAYHIPVGWLPFAISFLSTAIIVFLTTVYQTLKTATINPIQTIRND